MLIAIDIGNTSINIGYFTERGLLVQKISTHPIETANRYSSLLNKYIKQNHIEKKHCSCIISSVVTELTNVLKTAVRSIFKGELEKIQVVDYRADTGISFDIKRPELIGTDRIVNAAAAYNIYKSPVAVIDFGTATTITVVDGKGRYIGGAIMPGIGLMNEMLEKRTSKLKRIVIEMPKKALGKDTEECILSGLIYGTTGAIERIIYEIEKETGITFKTIITGGYGDLVQRYITRSHDFLPGLTLEGLRLIHEKNKDA